MNNKSILIFALMCFTVLTGCDSDDDSVSDTPTLKVNINGLEDLGSGFAYEGWLIVDGAPVTTGTFTVNENGELSRTEFDVSQSDLDAGGTFVLTVEPSPDSDPAPTDTHVLAGDFDGVSAGVSVDHPAALGNDFTASAGTYIIATPTDGADNNENSGVWFLDNSSGSPSVGLDLPTLPAGWAYEGWAVIDGTPVSTGTFTAVDAADNAAPFSGTMDGPPFPGEDFLSNAPSGLSFPTDLAGTTIVVSVEPSPDNSPNPFVLKPLVAPVPSDLEVHTALGMNNNATATNPTGTVTK